MNQQIAYILNQSIECIQTGRLSEAERLLKQVIKIQPKNSDALCFLSVVAAYRFEYKEALKWIEKSIESAPSNAIAHSNKGNILKELGRYSEAIKSYDKAISLEPSLVEPYSNKGNTLQELGRYSESLSFYDKAISLDPNFVESYCNKGNALSELGFYEEARAYFDQAISINPNYVQAWCNKGLLLLKVKAFSEAFSCFDKANSIDPNRAESWAITGIFFNETGLYRDALRCFEKSIELNPQYGVAWGGKAYALAELKEYELAIEFYEKALSLNSELEFTLGFMMNAQLAIADWHNFEERVSVLIDRAVASKRVIVPFSALAISDLPSVHLKIAKTYVADKYPVKNALPLAQSKEHKKIKLAYFSADFHGQHPVGLLTPELFELHDRSRFELYAFSLKKAPDGDLLHERIKKGFDHFIEVGDKSVLEIAKLSRELEIDIAVDLGGHTKDSGTEIMSYRAAPIQVNYLGYPGTVGAEFIDYIIADKILIPQSSQQYFVEKIAYLPNSYMVDDSKRVPDENRLSRSEFGLPDGKFIYCCFNNGFKFNRKMVESWARILLQVPESIFWISENNSVFKKKLAKEFARLGVESTRLVFAKRVDSIAEHLARYSLADLFLDTHPYNAHTTGLDALKSGIPVITFMGEAFAGRVGASLLNAIGLPELVMDSRESYEKMAIELGLNSEKLTSLKHRLTLNKNTMPLFDTKLYVANIEKLFEVMYRKHLEGEPVENINFLPI
jgi:predicted O-linked N-acetylglucosamine transferase (SPINDLY family)